MKKPKKQVVVGWTTITPVMVRSTCCGQWDAMAWWSRGTREDWPRGKWPPHKVRITVEYLE